jgi:hypothetical protein
VDNSYRVTDSCREFFGFELNIIFAVVFQFMKPFEIELQNPDAWCRVHPGIENVKLFDI